MSNPVIPFHTIVFDLDDTLLDTSRLLIPIAHTPEYFDRLKKPLPLIEGATENLIYLSKKYQLILLTQGRTDIQKQKIESMNIAPYFTEIFVANDSFGKDHYFDRILKENKISAKSVLSFGNRRSTDIRPIKKRGGLACLFLYGEHQAEPILSPEDHADFEIRHHSELISRCRL